MDNADNRKVVDSNPAPLKNVTNSLLGNPRFESHPEYFKLESKFGIPRIKMIPATKHLKIACQKRL